MKARHENFFSLKFSPKAGFHLLISMLLLDRVMTLRVSIAKGSHLVHVLLFKTASSTRFIGKNGSLFSGATVVLNMRPAAKGAVVPCSSMIYLM